MRKSAALIGPGKGPAVRVACSGARVQIRGIKSDEFALIVQQLGDFEDQVLSVMKDGIYELVDCVSAQVIYEGENRRFIACVLMGV